MIIEYDIIGKDHGIGISEQDKEHLFTTFFRARQCDKYRRYRFGAPYCKALCRFAAWDGSPESELNKGTTVSIELPVNKN